MQLLPNPSNPNRSRSTACSMTWLFLTLALCGGCSITPQTLHGPYQPAVVTSFTLPREEPMMAGGEITPDVMADKLGLTNGATGLLTLPPTPSKRTVTSMLSAGGWRIEAGRLVDDYARVRISVRDASAGLTIANPISLAGRGNFVVCSVTVPKDGTTFKRGGEIAYTQATQTSNAGGTVTSRSERATVSTGLTLELTADRIDYRTFRIRGSLEVASATADTSRSVFSTPIDVTLCGAAPVSICSLVGGNASANATIKELTGGIGLEAVEVLVGLE